MSKAVTEFMLPRLIVCDLDGTLLPAGGSINTEDIQALEYLGELGICRAIATGRSLFSYQRSRLPKLPLDYLIYATGAGIRSFSNGEDHSLINLNPDQSLKLARLLMDSGLSFMLLAPVPDNHHFRWWTSGEIHPDFMRRMDLYPGCHSALDLSSGDAFNYCSQAIVICDEKEGLELLKRLRAELTGYKVVRTTSPIDHRTMWIEIFPPDVSKGHAIERLIAMLEIQREQVWALGNDFNDLDMLEFAGRAFVVDTAHADLLAQYEAVDAKSPASVLAGLVKSMLV